jgi:hypothetical protein
MPKGSITSAALVGGVTGVSPVQDALDDQNCLSKMFVMQLSALKRVRMSQSGRYSVRSLTRPPWSRFFEEFRCRECGPQEAFKSRPRGFFERRVLPLLLLQAVRCERCYHRSYALRTIPTLERFQPVRKQSQSEAASASKSDTRVA